MDLTTFESTIHQKWAEHFNLLPATFQTPGRTVFPEEKYRGENLIITWQIGSHTIVQVDPGIEGPLQVVLEQIPSGVALTGEMLRAAWIDAEFTSHDIGLIHYLFPDDLPEYEPQSPFILREMSADETHAMTELHLACPVEDVDEAYVEVDHQIVYGCFHGDQLAAAASGYERTGFLDIGVLTHLQFRKKGLARAVTGALCRWAHEHQLIAQYRHNINNLNSAHVAGSLNFRHYFRSESLVLKA